MGIFSRDPKAHETTHRKTRDSPVFPIRECPVMCIYIVNKLRVIYWKLPKSFYRVNIVRSQIIFFIGLPVVALKFPPNFHIEKKKISKFFPFFSLPLKKFHKFPAPPPKKRVKPSKKG